MTFDPDISDLPVHLDRAEVKFEGKNHRRKFTIAGFGYGCNRLIEKNESKVGRNCHSTVQKNVGGNDTVSISVCRGGSILSVVALVGCLSSYLFFYLLTYLLNYLSGRCDLE